MTSLSVDELKSRYREGPLEEGQEWEQWFLVLTLLVSFCVEYMLFTTNLSFIVPFDIILRFKNWHADMEFLEEYQLRLVWERENSWCWWQFWHKCLLGECKYVDCGRNVNNRKLEVSFLQLFMLGIWWYSLFLNFNFFPFYKSVRKFSNLSNATP